MILRVGPLLHIVLAYCVVFISVLLPAMAEAQGKRGQVPKSDEPIIIVGGGLAGLAAALEVLESSADSRVILVDKEKDVGGNSAKASSGINGCNTQAQETLGINDSPELFYSDTMTAGDRENDQRLVDILVHDSSGAIKYLIERGVNLSDVNLCGGHSVQRTHWIPSPKEGRPLPVGMGIIRAMKERLYTIKDSQPDRVDVRLNLTVVGLVTWNDYITGVRYRDGGGKASELNGKAVILATGGFSADRDNETSLLSEFAPQLLPLPTTNGPWANGEGVKMARAMGAALVGMNRVQVHPTAFIDPAKPADTTKFLAAEALRGKGAILLNEKGQRFENELGRRDYLTAQIQKYCAVNAEAGNLPVAFMLMDQKSAEDFGIPAFNFYHKIKGFFKQLHGIGELAEHLGCDAAVVKSTLEKYNALAKEYLSGGQSAAPPPKDEFGKKVFPVEFGPLDNESTIFYVAQITPAIHYTMGGLKIDKQAFVFSDFLQKPFKGLLAAGEATGGVHGSNRLAGNSLLECVVYGRIAGRSAVSINYQLEGAEQQGRVTATKVNLDGDRHEL